MKRVKALKNGPIVLETANGNIALCRCGKSENRPYCDGHHARCGYKAKEVIVWPVLTSTEKVLDRR